MSAAFAECYLCPAVIRTSDYTLSDEQVANLFRKSGWTIGPTRCPKHVGLMEAPPRDECSADHDPTPMVRSGIATGGTVFGGKKTFSPRAEFCQWAQHYGRQEP